MASMNEAENEAVYEKLLKIKTTGRDDTNADTFRYPYEPTPYCILERLANSGYFTKRNTLLDYGCGKGRVSFFLSYHTKCTSVGIEYNERIYHTALENKKTSSAGNRVSFLMEDAAKYEVPEAVDRIFFFNPFSVELLHSVVSRIMDSYYAAPREMYLMFYYPSDEYITYLMSHDDLAFVDEIECDDLFQENKQRERILIFTIE